MADRLHQQYMMPNFNQAMLAQQQGMIPQGQHDNQHNMAAMGNILPPDHNRQLQQIAQQRGIQFRMGDIQNNPQVRFLHFRISTSLSVFPIGAVSANIVWRDLALPQLLVVFFVSCPYCFGTSLQLRPRHLMLALAVLYVTLWFNAFDAMHVNWLTLHLRIPYTPNFEVFATPESPIYRATGDPFAAVRQLSGTYVIIIAVCTGHCRHTFLSSLHSLFSTGDLLCKAHIVSPRLQLNRSVTKRSSLRTILFVPVYKAAYVIIVLTLSLL